MKIISEFKSFALKGNVVDLAIGVIIGAAFSKIISSCVDDILTPLLLSPVLEAAHLSSINQLTLFGTVKYGSFLSAVINFVLVAWMLFWLVKVINKSKKPAAEVIVPNTPTAEDLLTEIRDLLKKQ
ncbi:MAG: mechanosensitive ion channel protein MscL [Flavobacterium sp. BFFFF2]|nr:MAG: mechanosensitive ion channel protein MscL [Flavobacterium sp. BFFFF2]